MKTQFFLLALVLSVLHGSLSAGRAQSNAPTVYFALAVHSEEPGGTPNTPDFRTNSQANYLVWRNAILWFANECAVRGLPWNFQSEWNFLEGAKRFETVAGANYAPLLLTNTANKNVFKYLHENLAVELDPHSHEKSGYNYADVAYLSDIALDTEVSGVVGGYVVDPNDSGYKDWPKLTRYAAGLTGAVYNTYAWRPHFMMGGASASHENDPHVSGVWRPVGTNDFFHHDANGPIAVVGTWEQDFHETGRLISMLESGELTHSNQLWTCGLIINHRDMFSPNFSRIRAQLDTLRQWRDAGRITLTNFEGVFAAWTNAPFSSAPNIYQRPADNLSFSLNWQDFAYPEDSVMELRTILNQHEASRVPVDVFMTTWQTDLVESYAPELLGRLQSSEWVNLGYHVRAPKPYASGYTWTNVTSVIVTNYETHGLDLTNGLPTTNSGGYAKLTALWGAAPTIVGANADATVSTQVHNYFRGAGAGLLVEHRNGAVNLGEKRNNIYIRPESYDWKLIELYKGSNDVDTLTEALTLAHTSSNNAAPWFVGVKLHDNDLFAEQSAWTYVYNSPNRPKPQWQDRPWDPTEKAPLLSNAVRHLRRAFYTNLVAQAATNRLAVNTIDARDTLSLLAADRPRLVALSVTEIPETTSAGGGVARLSGGGIISGVSCDYALVSGAGDVDNGDFIIVGDQLIAATVLDHESGAVRRCRVRWTDGGTNTGERALTLVLSNITSDDDDGDGHTEAQELFAGTDPLDANSALRVSLTIPSPGNVAVNFTSVAGRGYHVEHTADFATWTNVTASPLIATGSFTSRTNPATGAQGFFRVRVMP